MADSPQEQLQRQVLIQIQTALQGVQGALSALASLVDSTNQASRSAEALEQAQARLSHSFRTAQRYADEYSKSLKTTRRVQKIFFETMRGLGGIARVAFGTAVTAAGAYLIETKRVGQSLLDLQTNSLQAASSIDRLRNAYARLGSASGTAVISLQDVATTLAKFQSQGVAYMATSLNEEFMVGFENLQSTLVRLLGKGEAANALESFWKSMGSEFSTFVNSVGGDLRILSTEFEAAFTGGNTAAAKRALEGLAERINRLRLFTTDQGLAAQQLSNRLQTLGNQLDGGEPVTQALMSIRQILATAGTIAEQFSIELQRAFGDDVARVINTIRDNLSEMSKATDWSTSVIKFLRSEFKSLGGTERIVVAINRAFEGGTELLLSLARAAAQFIKWFTSGGGKAILDTMAKLGELLLAAIKWFVELSSEAKIAAAVVAGIALSPGLSAAAATFALSLKDLTTWAIRAASATRALNAEALAAGKLPTAGRAIGAKITGFAVGAAATVGGHIAGRELAQFAGAEEYGAVDRLSGATGAAAVGAIVGAAFGPVGAAIGAAVAGAGSIIYTGIRAWFDDAAKAKESEKTLAAMGEASKRMTDKLRESVKHLNEIAVSDLQKLRLEGEAKLLAKTDVEEQLLRGEMTEIEARQALDNLDKEVNKIISKRREMGDFGLDVVDESYKQRIEAHERIRTSLIEQAALDKSNADQAIRGLKTQDEIIENLEKAGKIRSQINVLLKEREQILSRADGIDQAKLSASLQSVQQQIDYFTKQEAEIALNIDPRRAISSIQNQFNSIADLQKKLQLGLEIDPAAYEESLKKAEQDYAELSSKISSASKVQFSAQIDELNKLRAAVKGFDADPFSRFQTSLEELRTASERILPGFTESINSTISVLETMGPLFNLFGDDLFKLSSAQSLQEMNVALEYMEESATKANEALREIAKAELAGDVDLARHWQIQFSKAVAVTDMAVKALSQSLEASLRPLEKQRELVQATKDIRKLDLEISRQLYGTPALAVQAQLDVVRVMQAEKENLEAQLELTRRRHAEAKAIAGTDEDIFVFKARELELQKQIKSVTAEQLGQIKELRDGYLDAVQAQAFGAGRFSKIIISQEQNLMRGLQKGAMKRNFLLGQYAEDAAKTTAEAYRFSAQGMGILETMGGTPMTGPEIAKAVYERVSNIADPLAAAAAKDSADIWLNIVSGADRNTQQLGSIYMLSADRIVDAINAFGEERLPASAAGLALKGSPAGETLIGSSMDRANRGLSLPPEDSGLVGLGDLLRSQIVTLRKLRQSKEAGATESQMSPLVAEAAAQSERISEALLQFRQTVSTQKNVPVSLDTPDLQRAFTEANAGRPAADAHSALLNNLLAQLPSKRTPGEIEDLLKRIRMFSTPETSIDLMKQIHQQTIPQQPIEPFAIDKAKQSALSAQILGEQTQGILYTQLNVLRNLLIEAQKKGVADTDLAPLVAIEREVTAKLDATSFDFESYKKYAESLGAPSSSIDAMRDYMLKQQQREERTAELTQPSREIDHVAANIYFKSALGYFDAILTALDPQREIAINFKPQVATNVPNKVQEPSLAPFPGSGIAMPTYALQRPQEEKQAIDNLRRIDKEVRKHETAHKEAAGIHAKGAPQYTYRKGPDGKSYVVGGRVLVDLSPIPDDPLATIAKMQQIQEAALAPRRPSEQDIKVAEAAKRIEAKSHQQVQSQIQESLLSPPTNFAHGVVKFGSLHSDVVPTIKTTGSSAGRASEGVLTRPVGDLESPSLVGLHQAVLAKPTISERLRVSLPAERSVEKVADLLSDLEVEIRREAEARAASANLSRRIAATDATRVKLQERFNQAWTDITDAPHNVPSTVEMMRRQTEEKVEYQDRLRNQEQIQQEASERQNAILNQIPKSFQKAVSDFAVASRQYQQESIVYPQADRFELSGHLDAQISDLQDQLQAAQATRDSLERTMYTGFGDDRTRASEDIQLVRQNLEYIQDALGRMQTVRSAPFEQQKELLTQGIDELKERLSTKESRAAELETKIRESPAGQTAGYHSELTVVQQSIRSLESQLRVERSILQGMRSAPDKQALAAEVKTKKDAILNMRPFNDRVLDVLSNVPDIVQTIGQSAKELVAPAFVSPQEDRNLDEQVSRLLSLATHSGLLPGDEQRSSTVHDPRLDKVSPLLYAYDTPKNVSPGKVFYAELEEQFGEIGKFMGRSIQKILDFDQSISLAPQKADLEFSQQFESGPKDLLGYEIAEGDHKKKRPKPKRKVLDDLSALTKKRDEEKDRLKNLIRGARTLPSSDVMLLEQEDQRAKIERAATDALGLTYSGDAPERVPEIKRKTSLQTESETPLMLPPAMPLPFMSAPLSFSPKMSYADNLVNTAREVPQYRAIPSMSLAAPELPSPALPTPALPTPEPVLTGPPAPIEQNFSVADPTKVRTLSHGATGNWQSKGRGAKQMLQRAGQIIEEMGTEMDRLNSDQGNITQYANNRLFSVQPMSP